MNEMLCDDDFICLWSLQSHTNPTSESQSESMQTTTVTNVPQNVWSCPNLNSNKPDPFEILFGSKSHATSAQLDSGIISPQSQHHNDDLIDISNEELCRRLGDLLKKPSLEEDERYCLQQVLNLVQQLDALTPRSGPNSLNATSSSDEASSLDLVKSRVSDYSSASSTSTSSPRSTYDICSANPTKVNNSNSTNLSTPSPRIVATVQPYNSTVQLAPHNTTTDSPRKIVRCQPWQTNSLSESGVFVESDFYSDISETNACTQTDFEDSGISVNSTHHSFNSPTKKVPVQIQNSSNLTDQKRLQYYKERVNILEGKLLIYESSGDVQAKRLAERLQREIQLEKEVNELRDRVDFLESENATLEEEKCEFEEAENDTRLRLQRLEVELEIFSQRNVELEMSREAQSAKYKDCHSECLILRDDLAASETQIRHLEEDKQKAKENLEFLYNTLPLLLFYNSYCTLGQVENQNYQVANIVSEQMGNQSSDMNPIHGFSHFASADSSRELQKSPEPCRCHEREMQYLKDEVKCLKHQIKELNSRHYAALESADSHWVDLEREYKEREEQFRAKEICLKQKIQKLQDCLREDARSANEKICQLEEAEQDLTTCLVKVSKEHQKLQEDHQLLIAEFDRFKEQHDQVKEQQKPLAEALECEKKRNKGLIDELAFMRKLQQETEGQAKKEQEDVRDKMFDLKKDYLHIEVTNGELREEVATLELQIQNLEKAQQESEEKIRCLTDEIRTKDEICQRLEKRLERTEGYSLADELGDSPSKRFKREEVKDLRTASKGLEHALRHMGECERMLPTQKQFNSIARDVKKLADSLLQGGAPEEEETVAEERSQINNEYETPKIVPLEISAPPATSSSLTNQSFENIEQEIIDSTLQDTTGETVAKNDSKTAITVAMALMPQIQINETILSSCSLKKPICEVPSELRKLAPPRQTMEPISNCTDHTNAQHKFYRIKRDKRCAKNRINRRTISSLNLIMNRIVSHFLYNHKSAVAKAAASDFNVNESDILLRNISYGSFHSPQKPTNECMTTTATVSVACEARSDTKDTATATFIDKRDCSIQVNDRTAIDLQMQSLPENIRSFLKLLKKSSNSNTKLRLNSSLFNTNIYRRWKADLEFRQGLDILSAFASLDSNVTNSTRLESYEDFVSAMNCLNILEDMFKPHKIAVLPQIETEINERLMIFHNQKKESEFCCRVYYPVKRKSGLNLLQLCTK